MAALFALDLEGTRGPCVYLVHIDSPYKHAQHYVGYSEHLAARMAHHRDGSGSRFLAAVARSGQSFEVVRVWRGEGREFERRLHRRKDSRSLCPVCRGGGS